MTDMHKIIENLNTATLACDADLKVFYANDKCKELFKAVHKVEGFVGKSMVECHKPETIEKLKGLFEEYKQKTLKVYHYTRETPAGIVTIVNVPFYDGDTFGGVVEFIFESALG